MENTYENCRFSKRDGRERCPSPTDPGTVDEVYVNTPQHHPKPKQSTDSPNSFYYQMIIAALGLLTLCALAALCAVGTLYHNEVVSFRMLSEMCENATATLMALEYKAKDSMYMMQKTNHLKLVSDCNATERLYEELQEKHHKLLSACNETEKRYEMLKAKYQRAHEHLSACKATENCRPCEEGWRSLGLKCYYFSTVKLSWAQSRDYCVEKGGHLVILTSRAEQDFASALIGETHWIGLNDLETEGKWMWVNERPLTETGVTFWYSTSSGPHEPDNWKHQDVSGENCAALGDENGNTHKWFDASCRKMKKWICEK